MRIGTTSSAERLKNPEVVPLGKDHIMTSINLIFKTSGKSTMAVTLVNPKDSLTREEVNAAAAKLIPVLLTRSGAEVTELEKVTISTTTTEELV